MFMFLVANPIARKSFRQPAFYAAILLYIAIIALHFTLNYLNACIIPLLLFMLFYLGKNEPALTTKSKLTRFDKQFIFLISFGPFLIAILLSVIFGWALHTGWGAPLPVLWGLILVASSANYPGKQMAHVLTQEWRHRYHTPLAYVAGLCWYAGNIAYYSTDQPAVYIEWSQTISPWIDEHDLLKRGAIFIWPKDFKADIHQLKQCFPKLEAIQLRHYSWQRDPQGQVPPLAVWIGFLPRVEVK